MRAFAESAARLKSSLLPPDSSEPFVASATPWMPSRRGKPAAKFVSAPSARQLAREKSQRLRRFLGGNSARSGGLRRCGRAVGGTSYVRTGNCLRLPAHNQCTKRKLTHAYEVPLHSRRPAPVADPGMQRRLGRVPFFFRGELSLDRHPERCDGEVLRHRSGQRKDFGGGQRRWTSGHRGAAGGNRSCA